MVLQTGHPLVAGDPRSTIGNPYGLSPDEDTIEVRLRNRPSDETHHHWIIHNFKPIGLGDIELSQDSGSFVEFELKGTFTHISYDCGKTLPIAQEIPTPEEDEEPQEAPDENEMNDEEGDEIEDYENEEDEEGYTDNEDWYDEDAEFDDEGGEEGDDEEEDDEFYDEFMDEYNEDDYPDDEWEDWNNDDWGDYAEGESPEFTL